MTKKSTTITMTIDGETAEYVRADSVESKSKKHDGMDYAIVRSRNQGVMCGYVESISGQQVKLHQARQIWRYDSTFVLPDIAEHGPRDAKKMQMSVPMSQLCVMTEACGVLYCSEVAANALIAVVAVKK